MVGGVWTCNAAVAESIAVGVDEFPFVSVSDFADSVAVVPFPRRKCAMTFS